MIVSEQASPQAQPKVYPKGHAVIKADRIDEILHKLDTYGHVKGPLNWAAAPERDNWKDDTSTTWIIAN